MPNILAFTFRYIFIIIIYLFIFAIIRMVYLDISRMDKPAHGVNPVLPTRHPYLLVRGSRDDLYYDTKEIYPLNKPEMFVGRGKGCDIVFADVMVSSKHLKLWKDGGEWHIEDLGSRNGSTINGEEMAGEYILDDGDVVGIGELELQFVEND